MQSVKLKEIKALLGSINLKDSLEHLAFPVSALSEIQRTNVTTSLYVWLNQVVISEVSVLTEDTINEIHNKLDNFINGNEALSMTLRFHYSNEVVTLVLLKVYENNVANVLLSNLWLGFENIIASTLQLHAGD